MRDELRRPSLLHTVSVGYLKPAYMHAQGDSQFTADRCVDVWLVHSMVLLQMYVVANKCNAASAGGLYVAVLDKLRLWHSSRPIHFLTHLDVLNFWRKYIDSVWRQYRRLRPIIGNWCSRLDKIVWKHQALIFCVQCLELQSEDKESPFHHYLGGFVSFHATLLWFKIWVVVCFCQGLGQCQVADIDNCANGGCNDNLLYSWLWLLNGIKDMLCTCIR